MLSVSSRGHRGATLAVLRQLQFAGETSSLLHRVHRHFPPPTTSIPPPICASLLRETFELWRESTAARKRHREEQLLRSWLLRWRAIVRLRRASSESSSTLAPLCKVKCKKLLERCWAKWKEAVEAEKRRWELAALGVAKRFHAKTQVVKLFEQWKMETKMVKIRREKMQRVALRTAFRCLASKGDEVYSRGDEEIGRMIERRRLVRCWNTWRAKKGKEGCRNSWRLECLMVVFQRWKAVLLQKKRLSRLRRKVYGRLVQGDALTAFQIWYCKVLEPWRAEEYCVMVHWNAHSKRSRYIGYSIENPDCSLGQLDLGLTDLFGSNSTISSIASESSPNEERITHESHFSDSDDRISDFVVDEMPSIAVTDLDMRVFQEKVRRSANRDRLGRAEDEYVYKFDSSMSMDSSTMSFSAHSQSSQESSLGSIMDQASIQDLLVAAYPERQRVQEGLALLRHRLKKKKRENRRIVRSASGMDSGGAEVILVENKENYLLNQDSIQEVKKKPESLLSKAIVQAKKHAVEKAEAFERASAQRHSEIIQHLDQVYDPMSLFNATDRSMSAYDRIKIPGYSRHEALLSKLDDINDLSRMADMEARVHRNEPFAGFGKAQIFAVASVTTNSSSLSVSNTSVGSMNSEVDYYKASMSSREYSESDAESSENFSYSEDEDDEENASLLEEDSSSFESLNHS